METSLSDNRFESISKAFNLIAALVLVFNLSNPQLASASEVVKPEKQEHTFTADLSNRLFGKAVQPVEITATLTAYSSTPDQTDNDPFITASGSRVKFGTIAANGVPFGTVVVIPALFGDTRFVVSDRMNERYGYGRMDVWLPGDRSFAVKFGVKKTKVLIYLAEKK